MSDHQEPGKKAEQPSKAEYAKMMEDPYFQYLVGRTTRKQTWGFLTAVGSAILLLLGYAGFQFTSARDTVKEYESKVAAQYDQVAQVVAAVTERQEAIRERQAEIEAKVQLADAMVEQSKLLSEDLLGVAANNVVSSRELQRDVFDQHRNLLESVRQINGQAADNVQYVQNLMDDLKGERIDETLGDLQRTQTQLHAMAQEFGTIEDLHKMEELNERLIRARTRETITLRKYNSRSIYLPVIGLEAEPGLRLRAIFYARDLGRHFELKWEVEGLNGTTVASGRDKVEAPRKYSHDSAGFNVFPMGDTGYEYEVEYVNYGLFVRDFVMIRIRPISSREGDEQPLQMANAAPASAGP